MLAPHTAIQTQNTEHKVGWYQKMFSKDVSCLLERQASLVGVSTESIV